MRHIPRQLRLAIIVLVIVVPLGILGFMYFEGLTFSESLYFVIVTLTTVGYGDIVARSEAGRLLTIVVLLTGFSAFALAAQVGLEFAFSPELIERRQRRRDLRRIAQLKDHIIIAGEGELIDEVVRLFQEQNTRNTLEDMNKALQQMRMRPLYRRFIRQRVSAHNVVIITPNAEQARSLKSQDMMVIHGDPTHEKTLEQANISDALAMVTLSDHDTENLLTVMTARVMNESLFISAVSLNQDFARKMYRVGANNVMAPYEIAGQFLNTMTFRPTVNDFFAHILFDLNPEGEAVIEVFMYDDSAWIGRSIQELPLQATYHALILGVRRDDGNFIFTPPPDHIFKEDEVIIILAPRRKIDAVQRDARPGTNAKRPHTAIWQRLPTHTRITVNAPGRSLIDAEEAASQLKRHHIICDGGIVTSNAIEQLDPTRPFVIICNDNTRTSNLLKRGFRVIHGSPSSEVVLKKAGIERALSIMVGTSDRAENIMTVLTTRTLNRKILITATADSPDLVDKLNRAGADRVLLPFQMAARFVILSTTRPVVFDFLQTILYNRFANLETTELYIADDSPWVGHTIGALRLREEFGAGVIGLRTPHGHYECTPSADTRIESGCVLMVVLPINAHDLIRSMAYGGADRRPESLRPRRNI